jgi:hypothetical protein
LEIGTRDPGSRAQKVRMTRHEVRRRWRTGSKRRGQRSRHLGVENQNDSHGVAAKCRV